MYSVKLHTFCIYIADGYFLLLNSNSKSNGTNQLSTPCIKAGSYCLELSYISYGSRTNITILLDTTGRLDTLGRIEGNNRNWRKAAYNISTKEDFQVIKLLNFLLLRCHYTCIRLIKSDGIIL